MMMITVNRWGFWRWWLLPSYPLFWHTREETETEYLRLQCKITYQEWSKCRNFSISFTMLSALHTVQHWLWNDL